MPSNEFYPHVDHVSALIETPCAVRRTAPVYVGSVVTSWDATTRSFLVGKVLELGTGSITISHNGLPRRVPSDTLVDSAVSGV